MVLLYELNNIIIEALDLFPKIEFSSYSYFSCSKIFQMTEIPSYVVLLVPIRGHFHGQTANEHRFRDTLLLSYTQDRLKITSDIN